MDIEAVIAQATDVAPESKATEVAQTAEAPQEQVEEAKAPEQEKAPQAPKPDSELTPEQLAKREANRQSHLNSQLAKMRRENRELRQAVEAIKAQPQAKPDDGRPVPPNMDNYQTWEELEAAKYDYMEKLADWKAEQKLSVRDKVTTEKTEAAKIESYTAERIKEHATKEAEFAKANPDYEKTVYGDYSDFMHNLPQVVAQALIEADNASLALYALAKEGKLESLEEMSPYRVSMEIGKAEIRGERYLNQNKPNEVTNAPAPVEAAKGTGNPSKALANQSVEELMNRFNKRR